MSFADYTIMQIPLPSFNPGLRHALSSLYSLYSQKKMLTFVLIF
jgi:hypothetical protein